MNEDFIPISDYLKLSGHTAQNLYRWIREGKVNQNDIQEREKVIKVKYINKNLIIKKCPKVTPKMTPINSN